MVSGLGIVPSFKRDGTRHSNVHKFIWREYGPCIHMAGEGYAERRNATSNRMLSARTSGECNVDTLLMNYPGGYKYHSELQLALQLQDHRPPDSHLCTWCPEWSLYRWEHSRCLSIDEFLLFVRRNIPSRILPQRSHKCPMLHEDLRFRRNLSFLQHLCKWKYANGYALPFPQVHFSLN